MVREHRLDVGVVIRQRHLGKPQLVALACPKQQGAQVFIRAQIKVERPQADDQVSVGGR